MEVMALIMGYTVVAFIGILALVIILLIITGTINLKYLISEPNGQASLSRFQFLIFTFVVALSLFLLTVDGMDFPKIPPEILGLLGISGGSYVISKGIQVKRDTEMEEEEKPHPVTSELKPTGQLKPTKR